MPSSHQTCPICAKAADPATLPFCSPRCAQIDLGRWFGGQYAVPGRDGEALEPVPPDDA
jgi:endogenous inhibitor of DNA gyrase (YacG/DUF329 family)